MGATVTKEKKEVDPKNRSNLKKPVKKIDRSKIGQPSNFQVFFFFQTKKKNFNSFTISHISIVVILGLVMYELVL